MPLRFQSRLSRVCTDFQKIAGAKQCASLNSTDASSMASFFVVACLAKKGVQNEDATIKSNRPSQFAIALSCSILSGACFPPSRWERAPLVKILSARISVLKRILSHKA
ncbi:Hypothetical predicted protein [Podarcis lilfordi]|uniref:Uncharacterized protein n=1 Tax=Podarcis lilfordi TaxID=74358 RepID=A0AA35LLC6_9SAUR|nr:Hypothetical predicted protein [Podarcis lilfordi]